ncbi:selenite/tellurite reduction operon c-type cytochrome lipoprotein ExtS [Oryzomonas rubra]|uniref:Cytochrome C n=1 Tax=Oryzomonas rubra TaxID=2509454 RepID=A0A5A9X5X9_9BACT|nr:selenite/tellurite reduction operon c-type cytochrome lipoprotein ExtS [Oryzomonas rubra]KAA0888350.1 cytochrome C [Oryzomonas rubra]
MVALLSSLTVFLCLLLPAWGCQGAQCLNCHPHHYRERGTCTGCHRGNPASKRKNVAHHLLIPGRYAHFTMGKTPAVAQGNRLVEQLACRRCHVIGGKGNRLATPLDSLLATRPPGEITAAILSPAQGMPDFKLDEAQVVVIVNALFAEVGKGEKQGRELPLVVHFEKADKPVGDVFSRKCGPCHRMLTMRHGLLGAGTIGPNLSGLLTPFYPSTYAGTKRWTEEHLVLHLHNPRQVSPHTLMQPIVLNTGELRDLKAIIAAQE